MRVTAIVLTLTLGLLAAPLAAQTQPAGKVWRIGNVGAGPSDTSAQYVKALEARLADLGYVQGRNIALTHLFIPPQPARIEEALRTLVPEIDLLVAWGTVFAVAARKVSTTLPTVFLTVGDPVSIGLVKNLAKPGGNMTGVTFEGAMETYGKRLQLLKEILPRVSRVAVLRAAGDANVIPAMAALEAAAVPLGLVLQPVDVTTPEELESAFSAMEKNRAQAVVVIAGGFTYVNRQRIASLALTHRLPSSHGFKETVAAGGLVSLGPDMLAMAQQGAVYADKIMKGAKPGDLPVEQPLRYELHVNLKTAKALGLTIPPSLLLRADQVIE